MKTIALGLLTCTAALAQNDPGDWTSYGKNSLGWRYSELDQINTKNVAKPDRAMDVSDRRAGQERNHAAGFRRHDVRHRTIE